MAVKAVKQSVETIVETNPDLSESVDDAFNAIAPGLNIEDMIADQLLDDIDWSRVRSAMLNKAKSKLFAWLVSGNDTPVTLSPYPELAALPDADEEEKAA